MAIDLSKTTQEARRIYYDVLDNIGVSCTVDTVVETMVLYKDFENPNNELMENCKTTTFKLDVPIVQGSHIVFHVNNIALGIVEDMEGLCLSKPNQDPVSTTATILLFNSKVDRERRKNKYNIDRTVSGVTVEQLNDVPVYIERISYSERTQDVGIESELTVKIITLKDTDIEKADIILHGTQKYIVKNIDEIKRTETLTCYLSPIRE